MPTLFWLAIALVVGVIIGALAPPQMGIATLLAGVTIALFAFIWWGFEQ